MANQGFGEWLKKNATDNAAGKVGKGFIAMDVANLVTAENKLKALFELLKNIVLLKPVMTSMFVGLFFSFQKSIRSLVRDTGSLEAAMKKLTQIRGLEKVFAPLVGGAEAAKRKVAELVNFASSRALRLESVAAAADNMLKLSRGALGAARDLELVNDAAAGTGNTIDGVADAVGGLYDTLRGGGDIAGVVEQMRQMGVVSQDTANRLVELQQNGGSIGDVMRELEGSMSKFKGAGEKAAEGIESLNQKYSEAKTNLQEKFASPFVASEVKNTQNMTDALEAIGPTVERLGNFFGAFANGMGTMKTTIVKFVAETAFARAAVETFAYALGLLVSVAAAVSSVKLAMWLKITADAMKALTWNIDAMRLSIASSGTDFTIFGKKVWSSTMAMTASTIAAKVLNVALVALRWAMVATGVLAVVSVLASLVSSVMAFTSSMRSAREEIEAMAQAHRDNLSEIDAQISSITTLTQKYEAFSSTLRAVKDAYKAWMDEEDPDKKHELRSEYEDLVKKNKEAGEATTIDESGSSELAFNRKRSDEEFALDELISNGTDEQSIQAMKDKAEMLRKRAASSDNSTARQGVNDQNFDVKIKAAQDARDSLPEKEARLALMESENDKLGFGVSEKEMEGMGIVTGTAVAIQQLKEDIARAKKAENPNDLIEAKLQAKEGAGGSMGAEAALFRISEAQKGNGSQFAGEGYSNMSKEDLLQAKKEQEMKLAQFRADEPNVLRDQEAAKSLDIAAKKKGEDMAHLKSLLSLEEQIANLKSEGIQKVKDEYNIRMKILQLEFDKAKNKTEKIDISNKMTEATTAVVEATDADAHAEKMLALDKQRADIKAEGFEKVRQEYEIERQKIAEQLRFAKDDNERQSLITRDQEIGKEFDKATFDDLMGRQSVERQFAAQRASLSGDSRALDKVGDADLLASKFEEFSERAGPTEAAKMAEEFVKNDIEESSKNDQFTLEQKAAASSLARIGGGGGVENATADRRAMDERKLAVHQITNGLIVEIKTLLGSKDGGTLK